MGLKELQEEEDVGVTCVLNECCKGKRKKHWTRVHGQL